MKHFGMEIAEGTSIKNITVASGTAFPDNPNAGELFYRTDLNDLYVYTTSWESITTPVDISSKANIASPALTGNVSIDTNSSSPALRVTQIGAGDVLSIEDSANPDSTPLVVNNAGKLLVGQTTAHAHTALLQLSGSAFTTNGWYVGDATDGSVSGYVTNVSNSTKSMSFHSDPNNVGAGTIMGFYIDNIEKMRLNPTGMGVGGVSPDYTFHVLATDNSTTNYPIVVENAALTYGVGFGAYGMSNINIAGTTTNVGYTFNIGGDQIFNTNGSERLKLAAAGGATFNTSTFEKSNVVSAANIDLLLGNHFTKTISANITFTLTNKPASGVLTSFILDLTNGGAYTITWTTMNVKWASGLAPVLTISGRDVLGFYSYDGGTTWTGLVLGKDVK